MNGRMTTRVKCLGVVWVGLTACSPATPVSAPHPATGSAATAAVSGGASASPDAGVKLPGGGGTTAIGPAPAGTIARPTAGVPAIGQLPASAGSLAAASGGAPGLAGTSAAIGGAPALPQAGSGAGPIPTMNVPTSKDPKLPAIKGECPMFKEGTSTSDFMGFKGAIWEVGPKSQGTGSLIFYWHGTGSSNSEYAQSMPKMLIEDLKKKGGILVSPQSGTGTGGDCSGTATFSMDDFSIADQIAACAVMNWGIDPHRIYSTGCSAGGLQAGCMAMVRSSYMAGAVPNSGGEVFAQQPQDRSHVAAVMTMHGAPGQDVVIVDFNDTSKTIDDSVKSLGGYAVDCNHGGGHCAIPMPPVDLYMAGWQFMQDHPFGYTKEPYGMTLPSTFPKYCKVW